MAKDTSPVCFRLAPEQRRIIEVVAAYTNQSVSDFLRQSALTMAAAIVDEHGMDKILQALDEENEQNRRALLEMPRSPSGPDARLSGPSSSRPAQRSGTSTY
jgi:uncharacterized protein (DUF1778 family)